MLDNSTLFANIINLHPSHEARAHYFAQGAQELEAQQAKEKIA